MLLFPFQRELILISVVIGFVADLVLGDPRWFPHPVKLIGKFISLFEQLSRKHANNLRTAGCILAVVVPFSVFVLTWLAIFWISKYNRWAGVCVSAFLIYTTISIKDLKIESMHVLNALMEGDVTLARKKVALIVGRDTENLSVSEIIRATVETIAESIVDGIISPLFYVLLGGAPLAMAYKAISTLDSMVGYKNERYIDFGWCSAKLDDVVNYIPARLAMIFISLASIIAGKGFKQAWKIAKRDGGNTPSPNSGISEAAVAGALGLRLGGVNYYGGIPSLKPYIGNGNGYMHMGYIKQALTLMYLTAAITLIAGFLANAPFLFL